MPAPEAVARLEPIKPPTEARAWALYRGEKKPGTDRFRYIQVKGEPLEDGTVPALWPAAEFSYRTVLEVFGAGQYRVEWYDASGEHMKGKGARFAVAAPAPKTKRPGRPRTRELEDEPEAQPVIPPGMSQGGGSLGFVELLTLLRGERDDAQRRADAQAERDRQFWATMQATQTQLLTTVLGARGSSAADPDLIRREINVGIREGIAQLRDELDPGDEPYEEPGDPPADLTEAGERVGMQVLATLEQSAPHVLRAIMPNIVKGIMGAKLPPEAQQKLQQAVQQAMNGGHAVDS